MVHLLHHLYGVDAPDHWKKYVCMLQTAVLGSVASVPEPAVNMSDTAGPEARPVSDSESSDDGCQSDEQ